MRVEHIVAAAVHRAIRIVGRTVGGTIRIGTEGLGHRVLCEQVLALLVARVAVHVEEGASGAE